MVRVDLEVEMAAQTKVDVAEVEVLVEAKLEAEVGTEAVEVEGRWMGRGR